MIYGTAKEILGSTAHEIGTVIDNKFYANRYESDTYEYSDDLDGFTRLFCNREIKGP